MKNMRMIYFCVTMIVAVTLTGCQEMTTQKAEISLQDTETEGVSASAEKYEESGKRTAEELKEMMEEIEEAKLPLSVLLDVETILQEPELPTGCESVALTMLLSYEGYDLEKTTIADEYLIYSENWNFDEGYVGDPATPTGAGCFPPTIVKTADAYLEEQDSSLQAVNLTGKSMEELLHYVAAGHPVAVWTSMYMETPILSEVLESEFPWYDTEHCVVLAGYDMEAETVSVKDPLLGSVERDLEAFEELYDLIGQYAVVLL